MIVSVSRRTDIPAFYSAWFYNRIRDGFVFVENPMNPKQVSKIDMFNYYFQYTITGYKNDIERGLVNKREAIEAFKLLSRKIGKNRVVFRYDPIFINRVYTIDYHTKAFNKLCSELHDYTEKCVISFIDIYKKIKKKAESYSIEALSIEQIHQLSLRLSKIALKYGLKLKTCSEEYDLSNYGIVKGKCMDDALVEDIIGYKVNVKKDDTQRAICGCVKSVDIGQYNTCLHNCVYCYANYNCKPVEDIIEMHDKSYPLLIGKVRKDAKITNRIMKSIKGEKLGLKQISIHNIME